MLINKLYASAVILLISNLVVEKSGCRKCKTENTGLFVFLSHHDQEKCLRNLKWEEKVAKFFEQAYRTIDYNNMKDKCRQTTKKAMGHRSNESLYLGRDSKT